MTFEVPGLEQPTPTRSGLSPGSIVLLLGILAVILVIGVQLIRRSETQPFSGPAPDFTMPLYGGGDFRLSEQRGKVVIVNFWGSWCAPCREEAPDLQRIYERYADQGVVVVGVNYRDTDRKAREFIDEFSLTYPNGIDIGERITAMYNITGAPETFIVDQNGEIRQFYWGQVPEKLLAETLDQLLAQSTGAVGS